MNCIVPAEELYWMQQPFWCWNSNAVCHQRVCLKWWGSHVPGIEAAVFPLHPAKGDYWHFLKHLWNLLLSVQIILHRPNPNFLKRLMIWKVIGNEDHFGKGCVLIFSINFSYLSAFPPGAGRQLCGSDGLFWASVPSWQQKQFCFW